MATSTFFKIFPPPSFLIIKYAGLDISDDAIRCIQYHKTRNTTEIASYADLHIAPGIIENGEIKKTGDLQPILTKFIKDKHIGYAKVSLPEEKAYLFVTEVPDIDIHSIRQNIEFKLEENVPLSAKDSVFYFDILPVASAKGILRASVSVVPKNYVEQQSAFLEASGVMPIAFEIVSKSIAKSVIKAGDTKTRIIANIMNRKTGIYVTIGNVVCFTSTIAWGSCLNQSQDQLCELPVGESADVNLLSKEIDRVCSFWSSSPTLSSPIDEVVLVGRSSISYEEDLQRSLSGNIRPVKTATTWQNVLDIERYVPPISYADSLEYTVAAGLAFAI